MNQTSKSIVPKEIAYGVFTKEDASRMLLAGQVIELKAARPVYIGKNSLLKVNLSIGCSSEEDFNKERHKIYSFSKLSYRPDSIMDLSIVNTKRPLWRIVQQVFDGAVGIIPYYSLFNEKTGIDEQELLEHIEYLAENGISFMTLHPTASLDLYNKAIQSGRLVPTTSRGGYVLLKDQLINKRSGNVIERNIDRILKIFHNNNIAMSVGTVFRPANIWEAMDEIHMDEIALQKKVIEDAKKQSVPLMLEGIGHISADKLASYASVIDEIGVPLMPLGPMVTDEAVGFDHVNNAIGISLLAQYGILGMINSVTREEHTGKIPSEKSLREGLMAATLAAHVYNASRFKEYKDQTEIVGKTRAKNLTCVQRGSFFDNVRVDRNEMQECTRCRHECPLRLNRERKNND